MGWVMNNLTITEVSKVTAITGIAKIRTPEGELQDLKVGDVLQPGTVVFLADASVFLLEPSMPEAGSAIAELPADQQPAMPAMGAAGGEGGQTLAQINAMQQAILSGQDPTQAFEAAAAGVAADAGGGGPGSGNDGFISIDRVGDATIATAGYDTTGFTGGDIQIPELTSSVPENAPTLVTPDFATVSEDTPATGNVLANDSDSDDVLSVSSFAVNGNNYVAGSTAVLDGIGTLIINADGSYVFTPAPNWNGVVPQVVYTTNTDASSTLNIEVTAINDAPVIVDENQAPLGTDISVTTPEDTPVDGTLLATDPDNDELTFSKGSDPAHGTVTVNSDGSWTYTPNENYNGSDSFTAVVEDGQGGSDTITVNIGVTPVNDPPVIVDENQAPLGTDISVTTPEDTPVDGTLLATDPDNDELTFSKGSDPAHGSVTVNPDGSWTYTPNENYNGSDSFTAVVEDGQGGSDTITVNIGVTPVNDPPSIIVDTGNPQGANDQVYESGLTAGTHVVPTTTVVAGTFTLSDADGLEDIQNLTINGTTIAIGSLVGGHVNGAYGTLTITGYNASTGVATYSYQLNSATTDVANAIESDNFIFSVSDGVATSSPATITIEINDDQPVAIPAYNSGQSLQHTDTNLMLILDVSGSMGNASGYQGMTRLQVMQKSALELLEQYDALGNVRVNIITFSTSAANPTNNWVTIDQAKTILLGLTANGNTNYDDALNEAWRAFASDTGAISGAQNISYFMSDGAPNTSTLSHPTLSTYGTGSNDLGGGSGIDANEEADWIGFLNHFDIKSYALGMGTGVNQSNLNPIAYDGMSGTSMDSIVVTDLSQLEQTLVSTVVTPPLAGDILDGGLLPANAGADGGWIQSVTINGVTYSYDQTHDTSGVSGGSSAGTFNTTTHEWTISTPAGGSLKIDMDNGQYVYSSSGTTTSVIRETFDYTVIDGDGDTASSTLTVTIDPAADPLVVRDDKVITNQTTSSIPEWALLANDAGTGVHDITAVSGVASSDAAVLATSYVTYTDNTPTGGSFTYTDTAGSLSDSANVTVARDNSGAVDGIYLDEILIDGNNGSTLNGNAGDDVLIGNGGNDALNGGYGDDLLAGGAGNDALNGGDGTDTAIYIDASAGVTVSLAVTSAQNTVGDGTDTLNSIENLVGSSFDDTLTGSSANNVLNGFAGNDHLSGAAGNDTIIGGQGNDILTGGNGIDIFMWNTNDIAGGHYTDTIKDFSISATTGDKLDLSDVLDIAAGDSYIIGQDPNNAANAILTVTKLGSTSPDMTIILENHGGDALDELQAYLSSDENLIKQFNQWGALLPAIFE